MALTATHLSKSFGADAVLRDVSLTVGAATRIGVIGRNGAGKTTLLRLLAGVEPPDTGAVRRVPSSLQVGYLPQELPAEAPTARASIAAATGVAAAEARVDALAASLDSPGADLNSCLEAYSDALDAFCNLGGGDFAERCNSVAVTLGLPAQTLDLPTSALSGGQRARVKLAAILLSRHDVLLLDEPTNDLDFEGLTLLEDWVFATRTALVVVSHDRAFLERTITDVFELDAHTRTGRLFRGGYAAFLGERATLRGHETEAFATYTAKRDRIEGQIRRTREWAGAGRARARKPGEPDKHVRFNKMATAESLAAKNRIAERKLDRLAAVDKPWEPWELRLTIAAAERSGDDVAVLREAVVHRGAFTLGPVDLDVHCRDRIAITGRNGAGKTTLLDAVLGTAPLASGERRLGPGVVPATLDQNRRLLATDVPLLDAVVEATGSTRQDLRALLAKFCLSADAVVRPARTLSPGERTRALLAIATATGVNCLVLDEPTNHLDMDAIEQLESALAAFGGTLLLVTHDRRLLDAVALTRTIEVDGGEVREGPIPAE